MIKRIFGRSLKDILWALGPSFLIVLAVVVVAYKFIDPAPPKHLVIGAGDGEGDYETFAKLYRDILKEDGVELEVKPTDGTWENLKLLKDPKSNVEVGFVQDGLGSVEDAPDLSSLGSVYYEPIWLFYRGPKTITRFSELKGKRIAIGEKGSGTCTLSLHLLKESGVDSSNSKFTEDEYDDAFNELKKGNLDAAIFMATAEDPLIKTMVLDQSLHLMSVDQADAITRKIPYLHHLVLPHGTFDLNKNIPEHEIDLISPTATLLVKDSVHPALAYLLLRAATQVHGDPGIFEKKGEFPINKDYQFPLSDEARAFYKSGTPFWQRYLPFWLATLVERFIILVIPSLVLIIPVVKLVPKILDWRLKSRFYKRYGELKFLETQIKTDLNKTNFVSFLEKLDSIEDRVNHMKVPLDFSDQIYGLREHIEFVRGKLQKFLDQKKLL